MSTGGDGGGEAPPGPPQAATMFALDSFCLRQFDNPSNEAFIDMTPGDFMAKLEVACQALVAASKDGNIM